MIQIKIHHVMHNETHVYSTLCAKRSLKKLQGFNFKIVSTSEMCLHTSGWFSGFFLQGYIVLTDKGRRKKHQLLAGMSA